MTGPTRFSPEVRERAICMVMKQREAHGSQWAAVRSIAEKIGCHAQAPRSGIRRA